MQLYAQSDQESRLEAQGKFVALLLGDKAHLLTETLQWHILGWTLGWRKWAKKPKFFRMMVARDGVEPPTPAFSGLYSLSLNPFSFNNLIRQDGRFIVTILWPAPMFA
jgi:hypothetical protein